MSGLSADIEKFQRRAATWGAVAGMGGSLFQAANGFDAFKQTFNKQPTKAPIPAMMTSPRPRPNPRYI
jgi:cytochrome bd-type quinol oxidase subunit 1